MRDDTNPDDTASESKPIYERLAEGMRGTGVGTEDPNIIGDAGPTDVPPGKDPDSHWPPPETEGGEEVSEQP